MRILLTTDTVGGVWTFTQQLVSALCGVHEIALVSFGRAPSREQSDWARGVVRDKGEAFRYRFSEAPLEWMENNENTLREGSDVLLRMEDEFQPELLHFNQFCWGALMKQHPRRTVSCVMTAHSDVLSWAAACRPKGLADSAWLRRYIDLVQDGLSGLGTRFSDWALVAPTRWMLSALDENFVLPEKTAVIPNGIDLEPVAPQHRSAGIRRVQAVTAGRFWDEGKNIRMLHNVRSPIPILIAGETEFQDDASPLPKGVRALGHLSQSDLQQLFRESTIYVCTSMYEPFGLAPLEAALCGCVLLLNDIASLREVWGEAALYFSGPSGLESLLEKLTGDLSLVPSLRTRVSARAAELTGKRMAERYNSLYCELAERSRCVGGRLAHAN